MKIALDLISILAGQSDVEIDRMHRHFKFESHLSRVDQIAEILSLENFDSKIRAYLKSIEKPVEPKDPEPDLEEIQCYAKHPSFIPLVLYLASFKIPAGKIIFYLLSYIPNLIHVPNISQVENILAKGSYKLFDAEIEEGKNLIAAQCKRWRFQHTDIFYEPLYFDQHGQSQGGWGISLAPETVEYTGYGMLGGDTLEDMLNVISHTRTESKKRNLAKQLNK